MQEEQSVDESVAENIPPETDANPQEPVSPEEEPTSTENNEQIDTPSSSKDNSQEYNWKQVREEMAELRYENKKFRDLYETPSQPKGESEEDVLKKLEAEIREMPGEDLLTVEQAKKISDYKEKKSDLKIQKLQKKLDETTQDSTEAKLLRQYPDYFSVASKENVKELADDELFVRTINALTDPYDKARHIYEQLKLRGFGSEQSLEKRQLEKNAGKPRSTNSLGGTSPLHVANDYSSWPNDDLKTRLNKEMNDAIKGGS